MSKEYKGGGVWNDKPAVVKPESVRPSREEVKPSPPTSSKTSTSSTSSKTSSSKSPDKLGDNEVSKKAKKEYVTGESTILSGTANVSPNPKLKAKQTILIDGIGSHLSGMYYLEKVVHTFDSSGYTQSIEVTKNGVIDGMKSPKQPESAKPTPQQVPNKVSENNHKFRQGDTLWDLAVKHYGDGSKWVDIAKANNIDVNGGEKKISVGTEIKIPS